MKIFERYLYRLYESRLRDSVPSEGRPRHVGIILDGNRRWAQQSAREFHEAYLAGGKKLLDVLTWSDAAGVEYVTAWMLSTDNLERDPAEVEPLCRAIIETIRAIAARRDRRVLHIGSLNRLPSTLKQALLEAEQETCHIVSPSVNVAVGYGGRDEIVDALRGVISEHLESGGAVSEVADYVTVDSIADRLYTKGQPDPDLIIRTSGEQRLSGFLLWQSAHSEFYFSDVLWPEFRSVDFWRSLRSYASRQRRYGK